MTTEVQESLVRPLVSRRDIAEGLAGRASGDLRIDRVLADVRCRARLVRARPRSLQTLLVFAGSDGLLLVPYHSDPQESVDCVLAPRELALATWLGTVQTPPLTPLAPLAPLTINQQASSVQPVATELSPQIALRDTVLGGTGIRETLSVEAHPHGMPGWQALCVTSRTTVWGFGQLNESVKLNRGGLLGLWALLRQVAIPTSGLPVADVLGDVMVCANLDSSERNQSLVGGPK